MLETTTEIRWFLPAHHTVAVRKVFQALASRERRQAVREDWYMRVEHKDLGIKYRQGSIELKKRTGKLHHLDTGGLSGEIMEYAKWSFQVAAEVSVVNDLDVENWVPVQKERSIKLFALDQKSKPYAWDKADWPEVGCQIEITVLPLQPEYITFGLESFGPKEQRVIALNAVLELLLPLASSVRVEFTSEDCFDYPEWLTRFN